MEHPRRVLLSAYSCRPSSGSEPGAGFAIVRAAAEISECWVLTRAKNIALVEQGLRERPTAHPVHLVPVDASQRVLRLKSRLRLVRPYYVWWQQAAARIGRILDKNIRFDVVHHATFSSFWLPFGVAGVGKPLVIGPVSGGALTPPPLIRWLGVRGVVGDGLRLAVMHLAAKVRRRRWMTDTPVVIAQERQTQTFLARHVMPAEATVDVHPHASAPEVDVAWSEASRSDEVIFVGRMLRWKGPMLALHAFARADLGDDVHLTFIGSGPERGRLEASAAALGIADRVRFTGHIPRGEVLSRLRRAYAMLFPSFHDSAGFVVSEALTLGVPVVCLDHGGPGALTALWTDAPSRSVRVTTRDGTTRALAAAMEEFVDAPRPVATRPVPASETIADVLQTAYQRAMAAQHASPRSKPLHRA